MDSYPLLSLAPTLVEVELGCDNCAIRMQLSLGYNYRAVCKFPALSKVSMCENTDLMLKIYDFLSKVWVFSLSSL